MRAGVRQGRTVLLESQGSYPLQVLRPHAAAADGSVSLIVLMLSGGLLDGDEVTIDVVVEPGARLALRTQAATQAHPGRSQQVLRATLGEAAWFSYVPHALVPHAAADYRGQIQVQMQPDSRVLVADALSPGRSHSGEHFAYAQVRLDLDVWLAGMLVARERAVIRPDAALRGAQFGPATHTAAVYALGPGGPPLLQTDGPTRMASTALARGGWYVRAIAQRAADLDHALARLQTHWWNADSVTSPELADSCELPNGQP